MKVRNITKRSIQVEVYLGKGDAVDGHLHIIAPNKTVQLHALGFRGVRKKQTKKGKKK